MNQEIANQLLPHNVALMNPVSGSTCQLLDNCTYVTSSAGSCTVLVDSSGYVTSPVSSPAVLVDTDGLRQVLSQTIMHYPVVVVPQCPSASFTPAAMTEANHAQPAVVQLNEGDHAVVKTGEALLHSVSVGDALNLDDKISYISTESTGMTSHLTARDHHDSPLTVNDSNHNAQGFKIMHIESDSSSKGVAASLGQLPQSNNSSSPPETSCQHAEVVSKAELFCCEWIGCGETFSSLEELVTHVNDTHVKAEQDVIYKCRWKDCLRRGKGFNARYKMLIHVRTHTNEKPHKCNKCGKTFSRLENLKIHHRSHTGEKPYICPFEGCTKAYSNSSDRFKHVQTHKNVKPYVCRHSNCTKSYTDPSSLRKHMKIHGHYDDTSKGDHNVTSCFSGLGDVCGNNMSVGQVITISGQVLSPSSLAANPLLSSTVYSSVDVSSHTEVPEQGMNTAAESTLKTAASATSDLCPSQSPQQDLAILVEVASVAQDGPLDLSTSPSPPIHITDTYTTD